MKKTPQSHLRLRQAIKLTNRHVPISDCPKILRTIIWELMKTQTKLKSLENAFKKREKQKNSQF
jgi:hypothetical protein